MRTMAFTARKPSFVATCNGPPHAYESLLAKVQALTAPIKSTISQVYSEKGGCLEVAGATNAAATYTVGGVDIKDELGTQAPSVENPSAEVSLLQTAEGADSEHCTITLTTKKLGKDFAGATETITFTGDFTLTSSLVLKDGDSC